MSEKTEMQLDICIEKLGGIEQCLYGGDGEPGMRIDVDRLKRSRATHNAVLWLILSTVIGIAGTALAVTFSN
jgi:hypothetical protein